MRIAAMVVGEDYFLGTGIDWVKSQGVRVRLLHPGRVGRREPKNWYPSNDGRPARSVIIDGETIPGVCIPGYLRPGEDNYALVAEVQDDGSLGKPKTAFLSHIGGPWASCRAASDAYRAIMDTAERERLDAEKALTDRLRAVLGRDVPLTHQKDSTTRIHVADLRELLERIPS